MKKIAILLILCFGLDVVAQTNTKESKPTYWGLSADYGFLIRHTSSLREIGGSYPFGVGVDWGKLLITQKAWDFCNCIPKVGINASFWSWDKPDVLGYGIKAVGYAETYFRTQKKLNPFFKAGIGGAYLTHPFDAENNPQNQSYSTNLSFAIMVGLGVNYRLNKRFNLKIGANYNHISNGGFSTPNKGLNYPSLSVGVNRSLLDIEIPDFKKRDKLKAPEDKDRILLAHLSGWSNAAVGDKDKFYVFGFSGYYSHWIGGRSALSAGTEWVFDLSRREQIQLDGDNNAYAQGALLFGHEFWLGRVTFSQQLGIYYFNDFRINDDLYQRYGLTYHFKNKLFIGFNLKTHRHVADFFDLRIGIQL